jgi:hypothetical protein
MDAALEDVTKNKLEPTAGQKAAEELVRRAQEQGLSLDSRGTSLPGRAGLQAHDHAKDRHREEGRSSLDFGDSPCSCRPRPVRPERAAQPGRGVCRVGRYLECGSRMRYR